MSDLIERQAAIEVLCSVCGVDCDKSKFVYDGKQEEQVILCPEHYALTQLLPAQPEPRWIPVSERLPTEFCMVLACRSNQAIEIMFYNPILTSRYPKGFSVVKNDFSWRQDNVIAWMPLPEAYKEET